VIAPYGERKRWNHLWLVDPLDGVVAFEQGSSDFTVNIALIEDGIAMYGVVHSPARGVTYFGRLGKGAFNRSADGMSVRLGAAPDATEVVVPAERAAADAGMAGSHALSLCDQMARGVEWRVDSPADEWRVAAAHAVICASGAWTLEGPEGGEPVYNSERLQVPAHRLGRVGAA
jgi:3'(2'), 5'-bisphosphate nucleotidase